MSKERNSKKITNKAGKLSVKQYEELGRIVASIYETGYLDRANSYKMSFIKGLFQGLGSVLGATILVALFIWSLSLFREIPLLGGLVRTIQNTVEASN